MLSNTDITVAQLSRLIGLPDARRDYAADPRLLPCMLKRDFEFLRVPQNGGGVEF